MEAVFVGNCSCAKENKSVETENTNKNRLSSITSLHAVFHKRSCVRIILNTGRDQVAPFAIFHVKLPPPSHLGWE